MSRQTAIAALCGAALLLPSAAQAQGGKEFLQWLKEYSPTGYFIINDYETRANKPGDHKQWLDAADVAPMPSVAVHETCHMRDGFNSKNGSESHYVGNMKDHVITADFKPFNSKEMVPDIPADLVNFQTDVYINGKAGIDNYSMVGGLIGIYGEFNAYITGLKSGVELSAAFKTHFNNTQAWNDLGNDMTTSVWSNSEFRYFCLRYIIWAKKKYPDIYAKITTGKQWREGYTLLVLFAEDTIKEWIAVLEGQKMDTKTRNGFDWYWKFYNEIQKPEYKEIEALMLMAPTGIDRRIVPLRSSRLPDPTAGLYDLQGRLLRPGARGATLSIAPVSR